MSFTDYLIALLFGIVEGITEWLPVSSTGHMIILDEIFKLNVSPDFFDLYLVVIQVGAILAVIILFWKEIWPFGAKDNKVPLSKTGFGRYVKKDKFILWFKILVACIPAAIVGVLLDDIIDEVFYKSWVVAIALMTIGIAFIIIERNLKVTHRKPRVTRLEDITFKDAFIIGMFQLIAAVFPGSSRSGSTIIGSLIIGISRGIAAKFTFFLAIPVMLGASLLKIIKYKGGCSSGEIVILIIGLVSAFFVSLFAIKGLMGYIRKHDFTGFGWYRIVLGTVVVICGLFGLFN